MTPLVHAVFQSVWIVPIVWLFCRCVPRLSPVIRTRLWWAGCAQMLVVWLAASPALLSDGLTVAASTVTILGLWGSGVAVRLLFLLAQLRRARRLVREAVVAPPCASVEAVARHAAGLGLRRPPGVRFSPSLMMPVLAGLRRPVLLLPAAALEGEVTHDLHMAIAHELAHLRRRDLWLSLMPVSAQTMLFFHPFVWLAVREYALAREEACDAEARHITGSASDEYGTMLLTYVTNAHRPHQKRASLSLHHHLLLRRMNAMRIPYEQPKQGPVGVFCSLCVLGAVCVSALQMLQPAPSPVPQVVAVNASTPRDARMDWASSPAIPLPPKALSALPQDKGVTVPRRAAAIPDDALPVPNAMTHLRRVVPGQSRAQIASIHPKKPAAAPQNRLAGLPKVSHAVPLRVAEAADQPNAPAQPAAPDLDAMDASLRALRHRATPRPFHEPVSDRAFAKQLEQEMQADFGPRFRQQQSELRAQLNAELPAIRAQAEQAGRKAAQAQVQTLRSQHFAARARAEALKESAQARQEALQEADQAKKQVLKELPRLHDELEKELQQPLPPLPPVTLDDIPL